MRADGGVVQGLCGQTCQQICFLFKSVSSNMYVSLDVSHGLQGLGMAMHLRYRTLWLPIIIISVVNLPKVVI